MPQRTIVFAPGAGAPSSSAWMRSWARHLEALGRVRPLDYPYMLAGRKSPDRLPKLLAAHREAFDRAAADAHGPVVLVGKSMGSRVGCHLALEVPGVAALVCLGYPLRAPSGALRDEVLLALEKPILFVSGSRDPLCSLEQLEAVRGRMRAPSSLHVVQGGNHSLAVTQRDLRAQGATPEGVEAAALTAIRDFLDEYAAP